MKQFHIYNNYGVLGAEKRAVYSIGGTSMTASCYDKLTVEAPAGWEIWENECGELCATTPGGTVYPVRDLLCGDEHPAFGYWTPETGKRFAVLSVVNINERGLKNERI